MDYFLIFILRGSVVNICSYDEQESRDAEAGRFADMLQRSSTVQVDDKMFDEFQTLDQVR